jgi:hypothetical protein
MSDNYRCFVPGGFTSNPFDRTVPVSIDCKNPGAINGAAGEKRYGGYDDTVETTQTGVRIEPLSIPAVWVPCLAGM